MPVDIDSSHWGLMYIAMCLVFHFIIIDTLPECSFSEAKFSDYSFRCYVIPDMRTIQCTQKEDDPYRTPEQWKYHL